MVDFSAMNSLKGTHEDCSSAAIKQLADEIHQAFSTVGFVYLKNHGISQGKVTASSMSTRILLMIWAIMCANIFPWGPCPGGEEVPYKKDGGARHKF